jgi:peptidoglycan/LPS O-acetylase OafA/YrhL
LDFWRGVACLFVIAFHAAVPATALDGHAPRGGLIHAVERFALVRLWVGVPLFFVISGYCIAASAVAGAARGQPVSEYFRRRLRRIYPPYWGVLAVLIALGLGTNGSPTTMSVRQWLGTLTLTENWLFHFGSDGRHFYLNPAWSLCYEEQFYILVGLLVAVTGRRFFAWTIGTSLGVFLVALAGQFVVLPIGGFFFDGRWLSFAAGILVYWQVNVAALLKNADRRGLWLFLGLAACTLILRRGPLGWSHEYYSLELFASVAFAALLVPLHRFDAAIDRSRWLAPIRFCGVRCYSLYLVHEPISHRVATLLVGKGITGLGATILVTIPVCTAMSVAAGWAFYALVERHFVQPVRPQPAAQGSVSLDRAA